jgi:hypothetical protein
VKRFVAQRDHWMADKDRVRRYRASASRALGSSKKGWKSGGRIKCTQRYNASLVAWLTHDGRYRIGTVTANDR